jgi:hypothetical protein
MSSFCNTLVQEMSRYWILVSGCWIKQVIALSYLSGIQHQASLCLKQWDYDSHSRHGSDFLRSIYYSYPALHQSFDEVPMVYFCKVGHD